MSPSPIEKQIITQEQANGFQDRSLASLVGQYLDQYFEALEGAEPSSGFYHIIIKEVEYPLLRQALRLTKNNQKKAAHILGINRNTLRRKLAEHRIDVNEKGKPY